MATPIVGRLAVLALAASSLLLSGPFDLALLAAFTVARHWQVFAGSADPALLREAVKATAGVLVLAACTLLFRQLVRMTGSKDGASTWKGPGKVLLFPCRAFHERILPRARSFSYSYLAVGVPVGFEGNAGGMVSVRARGKLSLFPWLPLPSRLPTAWFTIDAGDYLARGESKLGLRGKLDEYLHTKGVDPVAYPYAFLVTAARFLGYHFNPVSFWYLYDADKRLSAMILEVNNTFDERRMYFLTSDDDRAGRIDCLAEPGASEAERAMTSSGNGSRQTMFKRAWRKDFHVSPFNSRRGSYLLEASDPLSPFMQGTGSVSSTISLFSSKGHCKSVATLASDGAAIDPRSMTVYHKLKFLASWGWIGPLTFPRILKEAFQIYCHHNLHVWYRPEPLQGTISRRANSTERQLEPIFRRYLRCLVEQSPAALAVKYIAGGIRDPGAESMLSRAARDKAGTVEELEFRVLTPVFYARFVYYAHDLEAFFCELNESCTIWVSRPELLPKFALKEPLSALESSVLQEYAYFRIIQKLRVRPERIVRPLTSSAEPEEKPPAVDIREFRISSMDAYVLAHESARNRAAYRSCVLKLFLADRVAFGSVPLLEAQQLFVQACLAWLLSSFIADTVEQLSMYASKYRIPDAAAG